MGNPATFTTGPSRLGAAPRSSTRAVVCAAITSVGFTSMIATGTPVAAALAIALTVLAAAVDVEQRRIPDPLVGAAASVLGCWMLVALITGGSFDVVALVTGAVLMSAPLLAAHLASPGAMGFGDVKLALVLGAALGSVGVPLTLVALSLAAGGTAAVGLVRRAPTMPFGPGLVAGASIAAVLHPVLSEYLGITTSGSLPT